MWLMSLTRLLFRPIGHEVPFVSFTHKSGQFFSIVSKS